MVTCTFTNLKRSSLTMIKHTIVGNGTFDFTIATLTPTAFSLTTQNGTVQQSFINLLPGTYDVVEREPAGSDLTSAVCSDGSDPTSINLAAGENITCTFTNSKGWMLYVPMTLKEGN